MDTVEDFDGGGKGRVVIGAAEDGYCGFRMAGEVFNFLSATGLA